MPAAACWSMCAGNIFPDRTLVAALSSKIQQDFDLSQYNSFGVAARAAWFMAVENHADVQAGLAHASAQRLPVLVLGQGSNVLLLNDFPGLVLQVANRGIERSGNRLTIAAGENWHELVAHCLHTELHGLENLALIPGTVGAAPVQNIGAYGVELAEFFVELQAVNLLNGEIETLDKVACDFAYRDSVFKREPEQPRLILSVTLELREQWQPELSYGGLQQALSDQPLTPQTLFDTVCAIRRSKLPDPAKLGNAGSFFKNPVVSEGKFAALQAAYPELPGYPDEEGLIKLPAAWLLEQAGWKGKRRGAAGVHEQHALVLVNHGGASGEDIFLLAQEMSASVLSQFGIALEPEVRFI